MNQSTHRTLRLQVTIPALLIIFGLILGSLLSEDNLQSSFGAIQNTIVENFGGFYILSLTGILILTVGIALSPAGRIRLGPDDAKPQFSAVSWFAMLFSAGMGIGLLFYGVAEPIYHFESPPYALDESSPHTTPMQITFFHWGLHPWALYAIVGLSLSFFAYRERLPLTLRSTFYPLFGTRIHGFIGDFIDTLAVISTLIGVATSLGLGVMQVNAGLTFLTGLPNAVWVQTGLISIITLIATGSVVSGLGKGVRRLSELNMVCAGLLFIAVLIFGPTVDLFLAYFKNTAAYLTSLPFHSTWTGAGGSESEKAWLSGWTMFYWAWWIAWAPFVGMFIAKISYGRTIREFIGAVIFVPTSVGFAWLTVFGNSALHEASNTGSKLTAAVNNAMPTALFTLFETYPLASILSLIAIVSIVLFFVTSSDSASLVIDALASGGNPNPPVQQKIGWALLEGTVAATLLYAGGLKALQTASLTTALPFCAAILLMCLSLVIGLRRALQGTSSP